MNIAISAESTIDLPQELLDLYDIKTIPFGIEFDGLKQDRFGISKEIFEYVEKTKKVPKTSAISPQQYQDYFEELKKTYDVIIHISLSSLMSSAYNNAYTVAQNLENVFVVDSKTLSTGIALLAIKARELTKTKLAPQAIFDMINEMVEKVQASFVLEKLNYLHKGGRCSAIALLGANILKIKPQIVVKNGKMILGKKYIGGMNKVVNKYTEDLLNEYPDADKSIVFITHSSEMPECQKAIADELKAKGFETIYDTLAGGTISSHCGPECIGILFLNK